MLVPPSPAHGFSPTVKRWPHRRQRACCPIMERGSALCRLTHEPLRSYFTSVFSSLEARLALWLLAPAPAVAVPPVPSERLLSAAPEPEPEPLSRPLDPLSPLLGGVLGAALWLLQPRGGCSLEGGRDGEREEREEREDGCAWRACSCAWRASRKARSAGSRMFSMATMCTSCHSMVTLHSACS